MSALFNFQSLLVVLLLMICASAYLHEKWPSLLDSHRTGALGLTWKMARVGERLSPYVSAACIVMGFAVLFGSN